MWHPWLKNCIQQLQILSNKKVEIGVKNIPPVYCLQETHFRLKDTHRLKVKEKKVIFMQIVTKGEQGGYTYVRQSIFNQKSYKSKGRVLYIDKSLK